MHAPESLAEPAVLRIGNITSQQVSHVDEQKTPDNNSNS
jgi:hypothetical protein